MNMRLSRSHEPVRIGGMPGQDPIRVVIIDDDCSLLDGLTRVVGAAEGFCCACAGAFLSVEAALPLCAASAPM